MCQWLWLWLFLLLWLWLRLFYCDRRFVWLVTGGLAVAALVAVVSPVRTPPTPAMHDCCRACSCSCVILNWCSYLFALAAAPAVVLGLLALLLCFLGLKPKLATHFSLLRKRIILIARV